MAPAQDREDPVPAGPGGHLAGHDRGDRDPDHHRGQHEPAHGRRRALDGLLVQRQERHRAEHGQAGEEGQRHREREVPVLEHVQRQDRLGHSPLDHAEPSGGRYRQQAQADDLRRGPGVLGAAPGGQQDECGGGHGEQDAAEVVDPVADPLGGQVQGGDDVDQRRPADRQVDVEDPAPGKVGGDEPADQRAADGGEHHHDHHVAHVAAALARRHDVAERRHRADHQAACAQALDRAERDQLGHRMRLTGQRRAGQEDQDRDDEEPLAAVHVAEFPVERRHDQGREDVGGHHPGQVGHPAEVADDPRQRGAHDEVVQHGEQNGEQEPRQDDHHLARCKKLPAPARQRLPVRASCGRPRAALPVPARPRYLRHLPAPFPSATTPATLTYRPASYYARL